MVGSGARLLLLQANAMMAPMEATPATADAAAMPIVRGSVLEAEVDDNDDESLVLSMFDVVVALDGVYVPLAITKTVPVPAAVVVVPVGARDNVCVTGALLSVRTHRSLVLQAYPKGQHCDPQVSSSPVRFVV